MNFRHNHTIFFIQQSKKREKSRPQSSGGLGLLPPPPSGKIAPPPLATSTNNNTEPLTSVGNIGMLWFIFSSESRLTSLALDSRPFLIYVPGILKKLHYFITVFIDIIIIYVGMKLYLNYNKKIQIIIINYINTNNVTSNASRLAADIIYRFYSKGKGGQYFCNANIFKFIFVNNFVKYNDFVIKWIWYIILL